MENLNDAGRKDMAMNYSVKLSFDDAEAIGSGQAPVLIKDAVKIGGFSREDAVNIEHQNIGYWSGYYDAEVFNRVRELYGAKHPIFGSVYPSPEAAYSAGRGEA